MATNPTLRYGSQGASVKTLQKNLVDAGYNIGKSGVDGIFGKDTRSAVKKYQSSMKLDNDGVVGKLTWGSFAPKAPSTTTAPAATVPPVIPGADTQGLTDVPLPIAPVIPPDNADSNPLNANPITPAPVPPVTPPVQQGNVSVSTPTGLLDFGEWNDAKYRETAEDEYIPIYEGDMLALDQQQEKDTTSLRGQKSSVEASRDDALESTNEQFARLQQQSNDSLIARGWGRSTYAGNKADEIGGQQGKAVAKLNRDAFNVFAAIDKEISNLERFANEKRALLDSNKEREIRNRINQMKDKREQLKMTVTGFNNTYEYNQAMLKKMGSGGGGGGGGFQNYDFGPTEDLDEKARQYVQDAVSLGQATAAKYANFTQEDDLAEYWSRNNTQTKKVNQVQINKNLAAEKARQTEMDRLRKLAAKREQERARTKAQAARDKAEADRRRNESIYSSSNYY